MGQRLQGRIATFGCKIEPVVTETVVICDLVRKQLPLSHFSRGKVKFLREMRVRSLGALRFGDPGPSMQGHAR